VGGARRAAAAAGPVTRARRLGRLGGLAAVAVAATPFACLRVASMASADDPPSFRAGLDMAIWMTVFGTPAMVAAWLLWRAWWRRAGDDLAALDGPAWLLAQVEERGARWRFAAGCARTAVLPPGGDRRTVGVAGALAIAAMGVTVLATTTALPAGRVFGLVFVGLLGGLTTLAAARSRPGRGTDPSRGTGPDGLLRARGTGPGRVLAGLGLAGIGACAAATTWYLAEHPSYARPDPPGTAVSLPPGTAVVLAVALAGCLWLALRPPRWLLPDRRARWSGAGMAVALAAGFVLAARLGLRGEPGWDEGTMGYLLTAPILVVLTGSALAAAAGRSFRSGVGAGVWAVVLAGPLIVAAWLVGAVAWHQQGRGLLLDGEGGLGVGANLADAVWWPLILLTLWALPMAVLGATAGAAARSVRRRSRLGSHC
jgi:hypothetical protein